MQWWCTLSMVFPLWFCCVIGFTPRLIRHVKPNWQSTNPSAIPEKPKLDNCQMGHTYAGSMQKTGNFRPQLTPSSRIATSLKRNIAWGHFGSKEPKVPSTTKQEQKGLVRWDLETPGY
eukprot:1142841-Pelagomonas_calceolata.AAC.13